MTLWISLLLLALGIGLFVLLAINTERDWFEAPTPIQKMLNLAPIVILGASLILFGTWLIDFSNSIVSAVGMFAAITGGQLALWGLGIRSQLLANSASFDDTSEKTKRGINFAPEYIEEDRHWSPEADRRLHEALVKLDSLIYGQEVPSIRSLAWMEKDARFLGLPATVTNQLSVLREAVVRLQTVKDFELELDLDKQLHRKAAEEFINKMVEVRRALATWRPA